MNDVHVGMEVYSYNTRIGVVEGVADEAKSDRPALIIRRDGGLLQAAAADTYEIGNGTVRVEEALLQDVINAASAERRTTGTQYASSSYTTTYPAAEQVGGVTAQGGELDDDDLRIPIMEEQAIVKTRQVERGGVRVHKRVYEREEVVEQPAFHEEVNVERVPVNQYVDFVPEPRQEGDTLIIPLLEEVLVVEKRLVVKEELRITKRRTEETQQTRVTLRQEEAVIERIDETGAST